MWPAIIGVGGAAIALGLFVWYKIKSAVSTESAAAVKSQEAKELADKAAVLQDQIQAKNDQERVQLENEVTKVLAIGEEEAKRRAALDLLARLRGVH